MSDARVFHIHSVDISGFGDALGMKIILFHRENIFVKSIIVSDSSHQHGHTKVLRQETKRHVSGPARENTAGGGQLSVISVNGRADIPAEVESKEIDGVLHELEIRFLVDTLPAIRHLELADFEPRRF